MLSKYGHMCINRFGARMWRQPAFRKVHAMVKINFASKLVRVRFSSSLSFIYVCCIYVYICITTVGFKFKIIVSRQCNSCPAYDAGRLFFGRVCRIWQIHNPKLYPQTPRYLSMSAQDMFATHCSCVSGCPPCLYIITSHDIFSNDVFIQSAGFIYPQQQLYANFQFIQLQTWNGTYFCNC